MLGPQPLTLIHHYCRTRKHHAHADRTGIRNAIRVIICTLCHCSKSFPRRTQYRETRNRCSKSHISHAFSVIMPVHDPRGLTPQSPPLFESPSNNYYVPCPRPLVLRPSVDEKGRGQVIRFEVLGCTRIRV